MEKVHIFIQEAMENQQPVGPVGWGGAGQVVSLGRGRGGGSIVSQLAGSVALAPCREGEVCTPREPVGDNILNPPWLALDTCGCPVCGKWPGSLKTEILFFETGSGRVVQGDLELAM